MTATAHSRSTTAPAPPPAPDVEAAGAEMLRQMRRRLNMALRGKEAVVEHVLACLLARAHVLLEDVPGLGKTTLAKALAVAVGGEFSRLQCTPDLLPGDVTGFSVLNPRTRDFEFRPGPVFADILLVDEINRATPRTQSALLEAMAEGQVTADNVRHELSPTFFVIATQNPVEHAGTYPLPEAQLDRFGMRLSVGYPSPDHELAMLEAAVAGAAEAEEAEVRALDPGSAGGEAVLDQGQLLWLQKQCAAVAVDDKVRRYLVATGTASRDRRQFPSISLGVSPRGLLIWQRIAQARARLDGRGYVTIDDVQDVAEPVLLVRLGVSGDDPRSVARRLIGAVPVEG